MAAAGPAWTFLLNAVSFLAVVAVLFVWRRPAVESVLPAERIFGAMRTGLRYVRHAPEVIAVIVRGSAFVLCASSLWALLPISIVGALFLVSQGVVQNLRPYDSVAVVDPETVTTPGADGKPQSRKVTEQTIAQGPVASQEIIKQFGTNGGGFFNANSSHPYENPTPLTNFLAMFGMVLNIFFLVVAVVGFGIPKLVLHPTD